jgi:hypothetical protein
MLGDSEAGFSIFWADDGLDTGPVLLQQSIKVEPNDTVDSLYNRFLYPEGIKAMVRTFKVNHIFRISILLLLHVLVLQERHLQGAQRILMKLCVCYSISAKIEIKYTS